MQNFCIRVSGSIKFLRRSKKVEADILVKELFTSMMLMDNVLVIASEKK
jgi:hypothetical protein